MGAIERFGNLKERKKALVVQSDLNRLVLRLEVENLRSAVTRIDESFSKARRVATWLLPLLSMAKILVGRRNPKGDGPVGWIKKIVQFLPALMELRRNRPS